MVPGLHVWEGDVRLFDPSEYAGKVDCVHEGFPCQPYSVAGLQAGIDDPRGGDMWNQVIRIYRVVRPKYLFRKTSWVFISIGFTTIATDLGLLGLDAEWLCIRFQSWRITSETDGGLPLPAATDSKGCNIGQEIIDRQDESPKRSASGGASGMILPTLHQDRRTVLEGWTNGGNKQVRGRTLGNYIFTLHSSRRSWVFL